MSKIVKLQDVSEIISGVGTPSSSTSGKIIKFLRITDLQNSLINTNYLRSIKVATKSFQNLDQRKKVKKGDVLVSIQGTIGKTAIANKNLDCFVSSSMIILRPKGIRPQYLLCAINSKRFQQKLHNLAKGSVILRVRLPDFRRYMDLPLTSESEQLKVVLKYQKLQKKITDLEIQTLKVKMELKNFTI